MTRRKSPQSSISTGLQRRGAPTTLGRPRDETADTAILDAAVKLLDKHGYPSMTIDEIAALAGVGKQTLYRRWPSKAAVVLEALTRRTAAEVVAPDTGSVLKDVRSLLRSAFAALRAGRQKVVVSLMAEAQLSEEFALAFREQFIARRREALTNLLQRGIDRGELTPDTDVEFLADMIYGPMWYRLLNRHAPIDDRFADSLSAFVLNQAATKAR